MVIFRSSALTLGLVVLAVPLLACLFYAVYAKLGAENVRTERWVRYRQSSRASIPVSIAVWWALWTYRSGDALLGDFDFLFWLLPLSSIATLLLLSSFFSRTFFQSKWKGSDLLRVTFWRMLELPIPLLMLAASFDALLSAHWLGILGLVIAAGCALLGRIQTRIAEGVKLRPVRSGDVYKRAVFLARKYGIKLEKVFVVPSGPGHLTNAYGGSGIVAVTDNFGEYLNQAELDATIGHELGHVKHRHGRRKLKAMATAYAVTLGGLLWPAHARPALRPALDIVVALAPIIFSNYLSRRFEFEADRHGLAVTGNVETNIRALALTYKEARSVADCNRVFELFMTHPSLTCRVQSLADAAGVPRELAYRVLAEAGFRDPTTASNASAVAKRV